MVYHIGETGVALSLLLVLLPLIASFASFAHSGSVSIPLTRLPPNFIVACKIPPDPRNQNNEEKIS